jgi:type III secretory pathway component EscR
MLRTKILVPAAVLLVGCAVGSAVTRNSRGTENVFSNVFFFAVAILLLFFIVVGLSASARALRRGKQPLGPTA